MTEQHKIERVFTLIRRLSLWPPRYSKGDLAKLIDVSVRTVERYLLLLDDVGYIVDKRGRYYYLVGAEDDHRPMLTDAETELLQARLADLGDASNSALLALRRKLGVSATQVTLPEELLDLTRLKRLETLRSALKSRERVLLKGYRSTSTPVVRDREVEPVALSADLSQLTAVEVASGELRTFALDRMLGAESLCIPCSLPVPQDGRPDLFGMGSTAAWQTASLLLTRRAFELLTREYPAARTYCLPAPADSDPGWEHVFQDEVRGFSGIARFIMGLPEEVRVLAPDSLRSFVRAKAAGAQW